MAEKAKKQVGPLYWLAARSRRFWIIVTVVALVVGYPLSFGPAIWLTAHGYFSEAAVQYIYLPVPQSAEHAGWLEIPVTWWGSLGVPDNKAVNFMLQTDEGIAWFQFTPTEAEVPIGGKKRRGSGLMRPEF